MARKISHTLTLQGSLVAITPLHTGSADTGHTSDMPLAVNGRGEFYLPGTSIAGAIRAWEQAQEQDEIWGYMLDNKLGDKLGHASFMIVEDAQAMDAPLAELWHGIGINRRWGGANEHSKFDRQLLPQGTHFSFRLQREVSNEAKIEEARASMGRLLLALEGGEIPFGGGTTRGFGKLRLEKAEGKETRWSNKVGILSWLENKQRDASGNWKMACEPGASNTHNFAIEIHWQPKGPLMSKAARDGMAVDALPFVSRISDGKYALTLPGSGIKGALRQHAERIVRTVLRDDGKAAAGQHFDQVDVPLVRELFGAARPVDSAKEGVAKAAKGKLSVDTCYASDDALTQQDWDDLDVSDESWRITTHPLTRTDHVAIDRWTGGAADKALFNAVEPLKTIQWEPIRLNLNCCRGLPLQELALLWLALRDLCAGGIPLGFGVNRGYGDLEVNTITLRGLNCGLVNANLAVKDGKIVEEDIIDLLGCLKYAWMDWIKSNQTGGKP